MSFPPLICKVLEEYSIHPPKNQDLWLGPWLGILTILFPPANDYLVSPQIKTYSERDAARGLPDLIIEVAKRGQQPFALRTALIVEIKNTQHWPNGIDHMFRRINADAGYEFSKTALDTLYWIAAVGPPHWLYGVKEEDGRGSRPLIDWHHSVHDAASIADVQALAALVHAL